jgi:hypothetical protein
VIAHVEPDCNIDRSALPADVIISVVYF